jgi:hypothetical protein
VPLEGVEEGAPLRVHPELEEQEVVVVAPEEEACWIRSSEVWGR